jgi:putative lipoprotein
MQVQRRRPATPVAALLLAAALGATATLTGCRAEPIERERLAAPPHDDTVPPMAEPADTTLLSFTCSDAFRFSLRDEGASATLFLPDSVLGLERTPAAVGRRYTRAGVELWHDVSQATLDIDGTLHDCSVHQGPDPWTDARLRGVTFRAIGQEPGWVLDVAADSITFIADYGERSARAPTPPARHDGAATTWEADAEGSLLRIVADPTPCADIMSGETFPWSVRVVLGTQAWTGCGRRLR